jgi:hypothetical protein
MSVYETKRKHCLNCKHEHFYDEMLKAWICAKITCYCRNFIESEHSFENHQKYIKSMDEIKDKVYYMLDKMPTTRNLPDKAFIFAYWHLNNDFSVGMQLDGKTYYYLAPPCSIERARRKCVEDNPDFAAYDETVRYEKQQKELGILAWVLDYDDAGVQDG